LKEDLAVDRLIFISTMSAAAAAQAQKPAKTEGRFAGRDKEKDVRTSNCLAARAVSDAVRTSLGPKGMDKMIQTPNKEVIITNDGATILDKLELAHPAAKMFVELSKAQDAEAGDGTTSVVVIAGSLLTAAQNLLERGYHPTLVSEAFLKSSKKAQEIMREMAIPVELNDRESLLKSAVTSLNSKVVSQNANLLAPIAVDASSRSLIPRPRPTSISQTSRL